MTLTRTTPPGPPSPSRRALLTLPLLAAVLLLAACTASRAGTPAAARTVPLNQGSYVALGDSYTSGPDIPQQTGTPAGCERSSISYPVLVAHALGLPASRVHDVSCSGATIADLTAPQSTGQGTNPPQLSELNPGTTLVTLEIGGNDVGFTSVLTRCVELDLIPDLIGDAAGQATPCQASYTADGTDRLRQSIESAATHLAAALDAIRRDAPHALVFVLGYPALLPDGGSTCGRGLGLTVGDITFLNGEEVRLNAALKQRAEAAGADYVDTYTPSLGHDACSDPDTRWIEPLIPAAPAAPLHPNARGEQGMADAALAAIRHAA